MIYSFAGSQFLFISLALLVVNITVKLASVGSEIGRLDHSLYQIGIYLFMIPVAWVVLATSLVSVFKVSEKFLWGLGFTLTSALVVVLAFPLLRLFF